jgi:putative ABC transport system permease protein
MTAHLLRLMWNRKRRNALLCIEIFCSFAVVAVITVLALSYVRNWGSSIGYRIDDVWNLETIPPGRADISGFPEGTGRTFTDMVGAVQALPGVRAIAAIAITPYSNDESVNVLHLKDGRLLTVAVNGASDDLPAVLDLEIDAGRWFSAEDTSDTINPVVINRKMATDVFGDADPIGQLLPEIPPPPETQNPRIPWHPHRIVGVIRDFRKNGEFVGSQDYMFGRIDLARGDFGNSVLVRTGPGVTAQFEERLQKSAESVARDWSLRARRLEDDRRSSLNVYLALLLVPGVIALFLLLMVALGLTGVLWQHVTERTREFGLRRAAGASATDVRRQVLAELGVMASFALVPGAILGLQAPLLPIPDYIVTGGTILTGVAVAVVAVYLVVLACGWYPSRMATAIQPAEALHYE